jgi:hypothetical protein
MITLLTLSIRHTRLALQEFAPHMAVLTLPGGYLIALTGWVHRHWPLVEKR